MPKDCPENEEDPCEKCTSKLMDKRLEDFYSTLTDELYQCRKDDEATKQVNKMKFEIVNNQTIDKPDQTALTKWITKNKPMLLEAQKTINKIKFKKNLVASFATTVSDGDKHIHEWYNVEVSEKNIFVVFYSQIVDSDEPAEKQVVAEVFLNKQ